MSVLLKDLNSPNGKVILYTKGADSIIIKRLSDVYVCPQVGFSTITNPNPLTSNTSFVKELDATI
jgi:magnesium-transporting ATPase (P-type)